MNRINETAVGERTGRINGACTRYGLSRSSMKKAAAAAEAEIKIGKCYLINYAKVDAYLGCAAAHKATVKPNAVILGKIDDACARYGLGRASMRTVAGEAKAVVKIGRCVRVNFSKVDAYMDSLSGVQ